MGEARAAAVAADCAVRAVTRAAGPAGLAASGERERQHMGLPERLWTAAFPAR
ncbi:MAG TPA: hypothetical protein VKA73_06170 [Rubrobacter sp.]|nr:hypothetical protein [Rubrobacter sp.]